MVVQSTHYITGHLFVLVVNLYCTVGHSSTSLLFSTSVQKTIRIGFLYYQCMLSDCTHPINYSVCFMYVNLPSSAFSGKFSARVLSGHACSSGLLHSGREQRKQSESLSSRRGCCNYATTLFCGERWHFVGRDFLLSISSVYLNVANRCYAALL